MKTIESGGQNLLPTLQYLWREMERTDIFLALKEDLKALLVTHFDPEQLEVLVEVLSRIVITLREDLVQIRNNPALLRTAILALRSINSVLKIFPYCI